MEPVDTKSEPAPKTMRSHWFEHVAKTRKKLSKGQKKQVSHRESMRVASTTWPEIKIKLEKKIKRAEKKRNKVLVKT